MAHQINDDSVSLPRRHVNVWRLLTAAAGVVCAATAFGFLGGLSWFLDLFSHFRVQYLVSLALFGVLFLVGRRRKTAAVMIAFACVNLGTIAPMYFGGQTATLKATPTLRAMLLNVNERSGDPARVKQVTQEMDPDIVVLVEISPKWIRDLQWLAVSHPYSCVRPSDDNFGIGLFSKLPLADCKIVFIGEAHVPSIVATIDTPQSKLCVIATHPLPPRGAEYSRLRNDQLDRLPEHIPTSVPVMLLGDLNVTPWSSHFRRLLTCTRMIDSSKGRGVQPTWPSNSVLLRIPLDHCLHSSDIFVSSKTIGEDVGSDHYPVFIDFSIRNERNTLHEQK